MEPLISIIIPTFNAANDLEGCLNSIIQQTYNKKEVLIVDGMSKDETPQIAENYEMNHSWVHYRREKDRGVYDAMNKGIGLAKGEWLYFLGADDRFFDSNILTTVFSRPIPSNVAMIYGNVQFRYSKMIYNGRFNLERILLGGNICHQAIFYRRRVFEELGLYDLDCRIYADHDFNLRCFMDGHFRIHYIPDIIAIYNEQDGLSAQDRHDPVFRKKQAEYIRRWEALPKQRVQSGLQYVKKRLKILLKK